VFGNGASVVDDGLREQWFLEWVADIEIGFAKRGY